MNVKSYLKGIGVGMIVASLILIIAGNMNKVSDEDVIARAKELGYVQSTSVSQPEVVDNTSSNTEQNKIEDSEKVESTEKNDANTDNATDSVNADNATETANTTNDATVSDDSDKTADNNATSSETVKVEIKSGMSSESAALAVKNAGLVESDTEFNKYLCSEGYDKRLRVGSFDIPKDADFETIAKSLCGIK
ncbi:hypothetical protein SAMN04487760_101132 [Lachnospiraceae bacterium G41]|nr:hypothetical protein SAMN04487760_101132 [Lachnospiraceae bacterium G41]